jgi:hypothetical protein
MTFILIIALLLVAIEYFFGVIAAIAAIKEKDYKEYYRMMWVMGIFACIAFLIAAL